MKNPIGIDRVSDIKIIGSSFYATLILRRLAPLNVAFDIRYEAADLLLQLQEQDGTAQIHNLWFCILKGSSMKASLR